ncbi:MAG TPA: DUF4097 family beta strand repeat-containing protein [Actinomycetes bacterium]|jgi:hypothetical protein
MTTTLTAPAPPPAGDHDSGTRTAVRVVAVVVALALVGYGAVTVVSLLARGVGTRHATYAGVRTLHLDLSFESVDVVGSSSATGVRMIRTFHWSLARPDIAAHLSGDTLTVSSHCPWSPGIPCTGRVRLVVPAATRIVGGSGDGHLTVRGVTSAMNLSSSDGGLEVHGATGALRLSTSDGGISATGLHTGDVRASTSDGSVHLSFLAPPTAVRVTSSDGSVLVDVPHDGAAYRVNISTSDGSRTVDVPTDPSSDRHVAVSTQDGSVRVETLR